MNISAILSEFGFNEPPLSLSKIGNGHINSTWLAEFKSDKIIIQSLNNNVFKDFQAVANNIEIISAIFNKLPYSDVTIPFFFSTSDGKKSLIDDNLMYRVYSYSENSSPKNSIFLTGYAYGKFIRIITDNKPKKQSFIPTISNFHSFPHYFRKLTMLEKESALKKLDKGIIARISSLLDTLISVFDNDLTKRIIHNDAKADNVILGSPLTVIDLDTVMEGYVAIDYGDTIRSLTAKNFSLDTIREVTKGYAHGLDGLLSNDEIISLFYGILYVTGELAVRYLSDYIGNSGYFSDKTPSMCLSRANELFSQLNIFTMHQDDITSIIYDSFHKN